jgi:hypothetical protein
MTFSNKPKIHPGQVSKALDSLRKSPPGTHCLVVYPDLMTLRGIYSHYTKTQLEDSNQMVLILPYYETTDMVRLALSGRDAYDDNGMAIILLDILEWIQVNMKKMALL